MVLRNNAAFYQFLVFFYQFLVLNFSFQSYLCYVIHL